MYFLHEINTKKWNYGYPFISERSFPYRTNFPKFILDENSFSQKLTLAPTSKFVCLPKKIKIT